MPSRHDGDACPVALVAFPIPGGEPDGLGDRSAPRAVVRDHAPSRAQRLGGGGQRQAVAVHPTTKFSGKVKFIVRLGYKTKGFI